MALCKQPLFLAGFFFHFFLVVFICEIKWVRDIYLHAFKIFSLWVETVSVYYVIGWF